MWCGLAPVPYSVRKLHLSAFLRKQTIRYAFVPRGIGIDLGGVVGQDRTACTLYSLLAISKKIEN